MAGELGVLTLDMVARTVNFDQPLLKSEKQAEVSSKNIASSFEKIEKQSEGTSKAVAFMGSSIKASIAAISISSIVSIADGYTQTAARIQNATTSAAEYDLVQKHLYETANSTYRSLKEAQEVYLGTSGGLKELGYNTQAVLAISDSLSYSFVHNATAAEKAQAAMDAYGKILDKNKVEADAWFSLMVAAPNILTDVSSATGKTTQEIRKLGAEGKLAAEDLHKGLLLSRDANKALADSMVNSAADGAQKLSNAIERTVGELNKGSGATGVFAEGLGLVADNINLFSGAVAVGAVGYLTAAIVSKSAALKEGVISSIASRQATIAEMQAQVQATGVEALRQKQLVLLAASEINMARSAYNAATTATARTAAIQRLTAAEIAHEIQIKRSAVSTDIYAASQTRLTAAGRMSLGVLGGPVGLGLIVASVAAGYLMMRDNTVKATDSLASQIPTVSQLSQAYQKLNEQQLITERSKIKNSMAENREEIKQTIEALGSLKVTWDLGFDVSKWTKYNSILEDLKNGAITGNEALAEFNKLGLSSNIIEKVAGLTTKLDQSKAALDKNASATGAVNNQLNNTKSAGANAASGIDQVSNAAADASVSVDALKKALGTLSTQKTDALYVVGTSKNLKGDIEQAKAMLAFRKDLGLGSTGRSLNTDERANFDASWKAQQQLKSYEESIAQAKRKSLDVSKQQTKEIKQQAQDAKQQQKEAENDRKEILQNQYDISYRYADRTAKMESDLLKEQNEIRKAYASDPTASKMYLDAAKQRHTDALKLYDVQLGQELYSFKMNEEEKLNVERNIEAMRIKTSSDYTKEEKQSRLRALNQKHDYEMAWMRLEQSQRISDAGDALRTDLQNLDIRYEYERKRIEQNIQISREERDRLIQLSEASQQAEKRKNVNDATANWGGTYSEMSGTQDQYNLEQTKFTRFDESQDVFDAQMALADTAAQREAIWQAHHERMSMIEVDYHSKSIGLQAGYGAQFAGLMQGMVSETSSAYAVLGGIQKGAALFSTAMNSYTAISAAWASAPFPYNLPAVGIATMETGLLQAAVSAISPTGYYNGGYTGDGGKFEYAGPAHKGEVVFSQDDIKRWGGVSNVEKMRTQRSIPTLSPKVGNGFAGREVNQKQASPNVNLNPNFVIVDQREKLGDYLYGPDGKKAFVKFFKQNRKELGLP